MIYESYQKVKEYARASQKDLFLAGLIFLVSIGSFGLGRLSAIWPEKEPIRISQTAGISGPAVGLGEVVGTGDFIKPNDSAPSPILSGKYVASKNGTAYHYPWCSGAKRIKEENKIWFQTKEEAESRGYKPAANCEGL
ncbi:MAG: hypothetical protein Q7R73_00590 [bacterium]|nr:hypothetical protein [bacterium]